MVVVPGGVVDDTGEEEDGRKGWSSVGRIWVVKISRRAEGVRTQEGGKVVAIVVVLGGLEPVG